MQTTYTVIKESDGQVTTFKVGCLGVLLQALYNAIAMLVASLVLVVALGVGFFGVRYEHRTYITQDSYHCVVSNLPTPYDSYCIRYK